MGSGITRRSWLGWAAAASAATLARGPEALAARPAAASQVEEEANEMAEMLDVLIVGGGPAGLSAALYLGRSRRNVLVVDAGAPRHAVTDGVRNFLTREGIAPTDLRTIAWEQMAPYTSVHAQPGRVESMRWTDGHWEALLSNGETRQARAVLLATGVVDEHPDIPGYTERWGRSIHHCPFCHGWEMRDRPLAALIDPALGVHLPRMLRGWSDDVMVLTHGRPLADAQRDELEALGLPVNEAPIAALRGEGRALVEIAFEDGTSVPRQGLFVAAPQRLPALVQSLGLALTEQGYVAVDMLGQTNLPMLWAAGDLTSRMQQVVEAASQGGRAGAGIQSTFLFAS